MVVARSDELQASEIVSVGRVGAAASKSGLIATVNERGGVDYVSVRFSPQFEPGRRPK